MRVVAVAIVLALAGCSKPLETLTEMDIRGFLNEIDQAYQARDIDKVVEFHAGDTTFAGWNTLKINLARATHHEFGRRSATITLGPDQKTASVVSELVHVFTVDGVTARHEYTETANLVIRDGRVMIKAPVSWKER